MRVYALHLSSSETLIRRRTRQDGAETLDQGRAREETYEVRPLERSNAQRSVSGGVSARSASLQDSMAPDLLRRLQFGGVGRGDLRRRRPEPLTEATSSVSGLFTPELREIQFQDQARFRLRAFSSATAADGLAAALLARVQADSVSTEAGRPMA